MKRGNYLWVFIFIIIILIFVKAFVSTDMIIVSPINQTYNTNSIELNWSVDESVNWCAYSLDGGSNNTGIYSKNITQVSTISNSSSMEDAHSVYVLGNYSYIASMTSNSLTIINVSDKTNPVWLSNLSNSSSMDGAYSVYVVGDYAYVASTWNCSLTIINVSNKTNPTQLSSVSNGTSLSGAWLIHVIGNYSYIVSDSYQSLTIINVTDKTDPTQASSLRNTTSMMGPVGVYVVENYSYVTSDNSHSLTIINVSNKTNITQVSSIANSSSLNGASFVYVVGDYAYVTSQGSDGLTIINVSDKTNPVWLSNLSNSSSMDFPLSVYVVGDYAYVTAYTSDALTIIDISNKSNPRQISSLSNSSSMNSPRSVSVLEEYVYIASESSNSLTIFDVMHLRNQTLTGLSDGLHNVTIFCKNSSENLSQSNYTFFSVDVTNPVISSFSCSPTSVYTGDSITCSCSATDAIDGNPSLSYTANPLTSLTGTFTTSCTATDDVNNSVSETLSYTVESSGGSNPPGNGGNSEGNKDSSSGSSSKPKIEEVKFIIYAKLKQGESKIDDFTLTNVGGTTLDIKMTSNLKGFLEFEKNLSLDSKESIDVFVNISVKEDTKPDFYSGHINISSDNIEKQIRVVVEVISKDSLFNISLEAEDFVFPGEEIKGNVLLEKIGEKEESVLLNYLIKDEKGEEFVFYNETRIVKTSTEFVKKIKIPEETKEGKYVFYVQLIHEGKIASDSSLFNVGEKVVKVDWLILFLVVVLVILLIIWIRNMIRKGKKK